jgi:hypothetical protein
MATLFYPTKVLRYGYRQSGLLDLCDAGVLSDVLYTAIRRSPDCLTDIIESPLSCTSCCLYSRKPDVVIEPLMHFLDRKSGLRVT